MKKYWIAAIFLFIFLPLQAQAKLPPKHPFSDAVWIKYTEQLIVKLADKDVRPIAEKVTVAMTPNPSPAETEADVEGRVIVVTRGLIQMVSNESEYAFVIGHELAHIYLNQPSPYYFDFMFNLKINMRMYEKQELECDVESRRLLALVGYESCASFEVINKFVILYKTFDDPKNPYNIVGRNRYNKARIYCLEKKAR